MKQVRIKDIAEKAGVSIGTVDRVLHNRGEVAAETRKRVLAIARELHYQPNILAQALTAKKQYHLAALLPQSSSDNVFWTLHPQGIEKAIKSLRPFYVDVRFFFFELHNEVDFAEKAKQILEYQPEGVIFAPILKKESLQFCTELDIRKIPYIFIDTYIENTNCLSWRTRCRQSHRLWSARPKRHTDCKPGQGFGKHAAPESSQPGIHELLSRQREKHRNENNHRNSPVVSSSGNGKNECHFTCKSEHRCHNGEQCQDPRHSPVH